MTIPTEPIGSIPRSSDLQTAAADLAAGQIAKSEWDAIVEAAVAETIDLMQRTGSPVVTDGEQGKPSFATYPIAGHPDLAPHGVMIPFADGHTRQLPTLTSGPFRYRTFASGYLAMALRHARVPVKQAVIAASALSLLYPANGIEGYTRDEFLTDLVTEAQNDIRGALDLGAHKVQIDFTEGRLSIKLDPSRGVLDSFLDLNLRVLSAFSADDRQRIGIHSCPGGDQDSTHSLDVDYAELLPSLLQLPVGSFYLQLASEPDRARVLSIVRDHLPPTATVFVGVIDPIDPRVETATEVCDRILEAAEYVPVGQLGSCDDCGFSPFGDDTSTSRETAFQKIRARIEGTELAASKLGR